MWLKYCEACSCESLFLVDEIKTGTGTGTFMLGVVWFGFCVTYFCSKLRQVWAFITDNVLSERILCVCVCV
jgi:hypothetical protein